MTETDKGATAHWVASFEVPEHLMEAFEAPFADDPHPLAMDAIEEGEKRTGWRFKRYTMAAPDTSDMVARLAVVAKAHGVAAPSVRVEALADRNWLEDNLASFPPIHIGRFFIRGSHSTDAPPPGSLPLLIEAATAFGTGEHESTAGCLTALGDLMRDQAFSRFVQGGQTPQVLDMGCGTGVLALAALKAWPSVQALAVDIDPIAVQVAAQHARANGLHPRTATLAGAGFARREVRRAGPYRLIFANILARPLCAMAADMAAQMEPGGRTVLAGLLTRQIPMLIAAYRRVGLRLHRAYRGPIWSTLVFRR